MKNEETYMNRRPAEKKWGEERDEIIEERDEERRKAEPRCCMLVTGCWQNQHIVTTTPNQSPKPKRKLFKTARAVHANHAYHNTINHQKRKPKQQTAHHNAASR